MDKIFPNSMLPRVNEIFKAADRVFTVKKLTNDASHYCRTCNQWAENMKSKEDMIVELVGQDKFNDFYQYLRMSSLAFDRKGFGLLRITFQSY